MGQSSLLLLGRFLGVYLFFYSFSFLFVFPLIPVYHHHLLCRFSWLFFFFLFSPPGFSYSSDHLTHRRAGTGSPPCFLYVSRGFLRLLYTPNYVTSDDLTRPCLLRKFRFCCWQFHVTEVTKLVFFSFPPRVLGGRLSAWGKQPGVGGGFFVISKNGWNDILLAVIYWRCGFFFLYMYVCTYKVAGSFLSTIS